MKYALLLPLLFVSTTSAQELPRHSVVPRDGFVRNEAAAIRIAEAVLSPIYGEDNILAQRPFHASLDNDVWTIEGTRPKEFTCGGVAIIEISKTSGTVLRVSHGK